MVDVSIVRDSLAQAAQSTRIVMRCLSSGRDCPDSSQRSMSLLADLLDLLYRIKDQISWADEKWIVKVERLAALQEVLGWFDSIMKATEVYFQPGGVGVRYFRQRLLDEMFLPRLEMYKIVFLLAMQPESSERSSLTREIRNSLKTCLDLEPASLKCDLQLQDDVLGLTNSLTSEHFVTLADLCNRRQKGTCRWILQDSMYKQWLLGSLRTLYCVGPPGAGKTFLASAVIDSLQKTFTSPDVATIFIFCQDEKETEQTPTDLLRDILAQLVYRKRSLAYATAALYQSESLLKGRASPKAYQNAIRAEINRFSKVFFVIDGLDMFSDKERILNRFLRLPEHAQFLVTLCEVENSNNNMDNAGVLNTLASPDDIQLYALTRICSDPGLNELLFPGSRESLLGAQIVHSVVEKSHGIFLLAKLHMDLLSRHTDGNLLKRALLHLPESLSEAYGEIMKQVVSQSLSGSRYIYWTVFACRPLSVKELKCATKAEENPHLLNFERSIQLQSAGLLAVDAVTGTVRFIHKTAKEYLNGAAARVFFPNAQKEIADVCLTVITPDEVIDSCYANGGSASRSASGGLLSYAAKYWGYHAREVADDEQAIQVLIKTFLNKLLWRRPSSRDSTRETGIPTELGLGKYPDDWGALNILSYFGILGKSKRLLEQGMKVDAHDNSMGIAPLHCAAYRGNDEMVEFLLQNGADINAVTQDGNTALHLATEQGQRKVIKLLLSRRANSQIMNRQGATSLQLAVGTTNDETTVPLLAKNKVSVDVQNIRTGDTALHLSIKYRRPRILLFLVEKGAALDVINQEGFTPLQLAAKTDNCEAISLLLQRRAQIEARSVSGFTALHIAAREGHWVAFDLLQIGGADINSWTKEGETLLHEQARMASNTSVASKLLQQGANIEARSLQGHTPLQCAALSGNKQMFLFLLDRGARVDVETPKGESLLHITLPINRESLDIFKVLLEQGLDVNAVSSQGWMPFHKIVCTSTEIPDIPFEKIFEYVHLLLDYGADINSSSLSATGETPLHLALMTTNPQPAFVSLLLNEGANVNAITNEGKTPLHLAAEHGAPESILRLLLEAGGDVSIDAISPASPMIHYLAKTRGRVGMHKTLFDQDPVSLFWSDGDKTLVYPVFPQRKRRDSVGTIIEDMESDEEMDMGESTLIGSEPAYVVV